jgi:outer membrane protein assembly factor BamB
MKAIYLTLSLFLSCSLFAQNEFVNIYDQLTTNTSIASAIKESPGGFITIGSTNNELDPDIFIIETDNQGKALWAKQCSGPEGSFDYALDITPTADGGFVFVGNSNYQRFMWKVDNEGKELWTKYFGEPGLDGFSAVKETKDGGLLAVGDGMVITKTDKDGNELWTRNKPTKFLSAYRAIHELENGDLLIGGFFTARDQGHVLSVLVKTDASGKALWVKTYGAGKINDITTDAEGNIYAAGNANFPVPTIIKISPNGEEIWDGTFDEPNIGSAHSVEVDSNGNVLVFTSGGYMKLDTEGKLLNQQASENFGFNKGILATDGQLAMAGFSSENPTQLEKFTMLKMPEAGFPSPVASKE